MLLNSLNAPITPKVIPELQCEFTSGGSTIDVVFCIKQLQEKYTEQNMVFVDLSKAFATVSRVGLRQILQKFWLRR